ncbi:hypothetical protein JTB14_019372 [Gonioctena quinquepunctata]|nr:hypothetical protein JTB14_019372 [Gonioctena quinquepunctata]
METAPEPVGWPSISPYIQPERYSAKDQEVKPVKLPKTISDKQLVELMIEQEEISKLLNTQPTRKLAMNREAKSEELPQEHSKAQPEIKTTMNPYKFPGVLSNSTTEQEISMVGLLKILLDTQPGSRTVVEPIGIPSIDTIKSDAMEALKWPDKYSEIQLIETTLVDQEIRPTELPKILMNRPLTIVIDRTTGKHSIPKKTLKHPIELPETLDTQSNENTTKNLETEPKDFPRRISDTQSEVNPNENEKIQLKDFPRVPIVSPHSHIEREYKKPIEGNDAVGFI